MALQNKNTEKIAFPAKLLIEGNFATLNDLYNVIETFSDANLNFKYQESRTIAEIIQHTMCCQKCLYLNSIVLGIKTECTCKKPVTIKEALLEIQEFQDYFFEVIKKIKTNEFCNEVTTEWGQTMTKEIALFQSITQLSYHISEICFLAGLGGFYKNTLG